jgi:hypothetical protein
MSRKLFSYSILRDIFDASREIRMLTTGSPHRLSPAPEIRTMSPLHLPDVRSPTQYLIDMGLKPALAKRMSTIYMDFVARYRQVTESHFRRAIHGSCNINPEHYRNIFIVQFRSTIQELQSRIMSISWVWVCRAGLIPAPVCFQRIDVRILFIRFCPN